MLRKCYWIVSYTAHCTAFCLGGPFFPGHGVVNAVLIRFIHIDRWPATHSVQQSFDMCGCLIFFICGFWDLWFWLFMVVFCINCIKHMLLSVPLL